MDKKDEICKLEADIIEIENFLSNIFDRNKAIVIIKKHHFTDFNIMISDMVLNVNTNTLTTETPSKICWYIRAIEIYLSAKLETLKNSQ